MDSSKFHNYDEDEFEEMFNKLRLNKLSSNILDSPPAQRNRSSSIGHTPYTTGGYSSDTPRSSKSPQVKYERKMVRKMLKFSSSEKLEENNKMVEQLELDLNKTYSVKTMDPNQLALMLAALED